MLASLALACLLLVACAQSPTPEDRQKEEARALVFDHKRQKALLVRPDGSDEQVVAGFPHGGDGFWKASPDRSRLAHWNGKGIWVADVPDFRFERIVSRRDLSGLSLPDVAWTPDGERLVYVTHESLGGQTEPQGDTFESRVWAVRRVGGDRRLIKSWTMLELVSLAGVGPGDVVYWFENSGHGNVRYHLSTLDIATGKTARLMEEDDGIGPGAFQLSKDFTSLYYSTETTNGGPVIERDLVTGDRRSFGDKTSVHLMLPASEDRLFYRHTPQSRGPGAIYRVTLPEGSVETFLEDPGEDYPTNLVTVSPDGRYLWVATDCYCEFDDSLEPLDPMIVDASSGDVVALFPLAPSFLAWITLPGDGL